jgi:outer membrane protein TolC
MLAAHRARAWLGLVALALTSSSARAEDLNQAWQTAIRVNQGLQAEQAGSLAAGESVAAEKASRIPSIRSNTGTIYLGESPRFSTQTVLPGQTSAVPLNSPILGKNQHFVPYSFTAASVPIYTGGRIQGAIDAAQGQLGAQRAVEFRTALDLKLTVAEAYISVLQAQRQLQVARSHVAQLASFSNDVNNRVDQGVATRNDQLAAEVALNTARLGEVRAVNALDNAWAAYNRYLCRPPYTNVPLDEIASQPFYSADGDPVARAMAMGTRGPSPETEALVQQAMRLRPELVELSEQARSLEAQGRVAASGNKPQVVMSGGLLYAGSDSLNPQTNFVGTAMVDWKLFDGHASKRRTSALTLQQEAVKKRRNDAAADIALQVRVQWNNLQEARVSVGVALHAVSQAEENIRVVIDRYQKQVSTYTEVLDAETRRLESLTNYYDAFYSQSLAEMRLHRAVGDL